MMVQLHGAKVSKFKYFQFRAKLKTIGYLQENEHFNNYIVALKIYFSKTFLRFAKNYRFIGHNIFFYSTDVYMYIRMQIQSFEKHESNMPKIVLHFIEVRSKVH